MRDRRRLRLDTMGPDALKVGIGRPQIKRIASLLLQVEERCEEAFDCSTVRRILGKVFISKGSLARSNRRTFRIFGYRISL